MPIKTPVFPNPLSSFSAGIGMVLTVPSINLAKWLRDIGFKLIKHGTSYAGRPKGLSCAGFVLSCIAAVALKDEIRALKPEDGWVSFKNGHAPLDPETAFAQTWNQAQSKMQKGDESKPGLDTLLTDEQIKQFDVRRLIAKLTPFLAYLDPHRPSVQAFADGLSNDTEHWECLGELNEIKLNSHVTDASKQFNKADYHAENRQILADIKENRERFKEQFGVHAFANKHYQATSFFKKVVAHFTHETPSNIAETSHIKTQQRR